MNYQNAVAYLRYSSDNQTENSIEYQREAIMKYCADKGITLIDEYIDEAQSATTAQRPAFQKMIKDASSNPPWGTILIYDLSRMFRNRADAVTYKSSLRYLGFHIVSVTQSFTENNDCDFLEGFFDLVNDMYSKDNAKRTHAGMKVKAAKAFHCGGVPPLGYDLDADKKLIINEDEAETVREIFRLYLLDYSYKSIADQLNQKGLRTKAGFPFTKNSFSNILTQEKYIGTYHWNKRKGKKINGQRNNHAYKNVDEQIVIEHGCPAIIEESVFQRVQEKLRSRAGGKASSKARHRYLFGGMKIEKCSVCGSYMVGKVTISHGRRYTTYSCPNHKGGICPTKDIRADRLEDYVAAILTKNLLANRNLEKINHICLENTHSTKSSLGKKLRSVNSRIKNITKALERQPSDALLDSLCTLEKEKNALETQRSDMEKKIPAISKDALKSVRRAFMDELLHSDTPEVRELLRAYLKEISIDNQGATIKLAV